MMHRAGTVAGVVLALVIAAGCGLTKGATGGDDVPAVAASEPAFEPVTEEPTTEAPTPAPTKTTKPAKPKPKPSKATPTVDPNNFQPPACATYVGKAVSKSSAKSALNAAAAKHYWPTSAPGLVVPSDLVRSIAWNESGWQSNIRNCDGGHGLMQVMPDTVSMINSRFGQAYAVDDVKQNATIGANYLAWLTKYVGDAYFGGSYNLSASKCKSATSWCLLNAVIAGYHAGAGAVDAGAAGKQVPSSDYVYVVRSLMKSCFCDRY
jgi:soluble lytic murein transglycosylase-like protein